MTDEDKKYEDLVESHIKIIKAVQNMIDKATENHLEAEVVLSFANEYYHIMEFYKGKKEIDPIEESERIVRATYDSLYEWDIT